MAALSHRHQAVLGEGLGSCTSVSGSREPRRVPEQGWDRGRLAARCGAIRAGREGTRGSTGEGSRGGGAEGDAGLCGPGHRSPWMPIMCSRMSTLSAKIFRASRSCCTPSPWGGGSRGVRATLLQRPVPARHFPLVTIVNATATTDETPRQPGLGFELQFTDTELEAQTSQPHSPEVAKPEVAKPEVARPEVAKPGASHSHVCLRLELAAPMAASCLPVHPSF